MLTKRNDHNLTAYRRHEPKCPLKGDPQELQRCRCPLYAQGKVHGKYVRKGLNTRDPKVALAMIEAMLHPPTDGGDGPRGGLALVPQPGLMTLEYVQKEFLESKGKDSEDAKVRRAANTIELYERAVEHFRQWAQMHSLTLLSQIDTAEIRDYFKEYAPQWKRNTAAGRLTHLRVFFNFCGPKNRRWIQFVPTANPELNYKKPKSKKGQNIANPPFSLEEVDRILAACEQMPEGERDRARALISLLLSTGMRISDATFFERSYVTPDNEALYYVIKTGKQIDLPPEISPQALAALAKLPVNRVYYFQADMEGDYQEAREALREEEGEFSQLMPDYKNRIRQATELVERVLKLAGVSGNCHRFRDTFAINLVWAGVDIFTVCQMLGHSDVKITMDHYMKFSPDYQKRMSRATRKLAYFPQAA